MPYTINKSDGTFLVVVNDGATDKSATSLSLPAKNVLTYGRDVAENFVYLTENFANTSPPASPLSGQLWFDTAANVLREYTAGSWIQVGLNAFNTTADLLPGPTIGGGSSSTNRIGGTTGYPLSYGGNSTTISVLTGEGKIIAVISPETIPNGSLPATIVLQYRSFDFRVRFPNGLVAGMTLAADSANYTYGGSNQFTNLLSQVPYLLGGDDTSTAPNHIAVDVPAPLSGYVKYLGVEARVSNTNTGATLISVNSIGEVPVVRRSGVPLSAGDLLAGYYYKFLFDGNQFRVDDAQANGYVGPTGPTGPAGPVGAASTVAGPAGPAGAAGTSGTPIVFIGDDGNFNEQNANGRTTLTQTLIPNPPSPVPANNVAVFSMPSANSGATTLNGMPVLRASGSPLQANDILSGQRVIVVSDGKGNWIHNGICYGEIQRVVANAVLYVDSQTGNDSFNTGSQVAPFKTVTACLNYALNNISIPGGLTVILSRAGTYDIPEYFPGISGTVTIRGDMGNQAGFVLTRSTISAALTIVTGTTVLNLQGLTLTHPGGAYGGLIASAGGAINLQNVSYGVATGRNMANASVMQINSNSSISVAGGCVFSGDAPTGAWAFCNGGVFSTGGLDPANPVTISFTGTPNYGYTFIVNSLSAAYLLVGLQFNGTVRANQWGIQSLGLLSTGNRITTFVPGQATYNFNKGILQ